MINYNRNFLLYRLNEEQLTLIQRLTLSYIDRTQTCLAFLYNKFCCHCWQISMCHLEKKLNSLTDSSTAPGA